jgi:hypothetical protein
MTDMMGQGEGVACRAAGDAGAISAERLRSDWALPRRFWLVRRPREEVVAEGVVWSGGKVTVHRSEHIVWSGQWASLDDLLKSHGQAVAVAWVDDNDDLHRECVEYYDGAVWIH